MKSIWDVRFTKKKLAMDAAVKNAFVALDEWLTVHPNGPDNVGRHIELDESGRIINGMGGSHNGEKLSELKIKSAFPKEYHREETNPDNINHKGFLNRVWGYNRENRESAGQRKYMTQKEYFAKRNEIQEGMKGLKKDSPEWKAARQEVENLKEAYHKGVEMEKREGRNALHAEEPKPSYVKDISRDEHGDKLPKVATPKNLEGAADYFHEMSEEYGKDRYNDSTAARKSEEYGTWARRAGEWEDCTKARLDDKYSGYGMEDEPQSVRDDAMHQAAKTDLNWYFKDVGTDPRGVDKWMAKDMYNKYEKYLSDEDKKDFKAKMSKW